MAVLRCIPSCVREGEGEKFPNVFCQRLQIAPIYTSCHPPTQLEMHQHQIERHFFRRGNGLCCQVSICCNDAVQFRAFRYLTPKRAMSFRKRQQVLCFPCSGFLPDCYACENKPANDPNRLNDGKPVAFNPSEEIHHEPVLRLRTPSGNAKRKQCFSSLSIFACSVAAVGPSRCESSLHVSDQASQRLARGCPLSPQDVAKSA